MILSNWLIPFTSPESPDRCRGMRRHDGHVGLAFAHLQLLGHAAPDEWDITMALRVLIGPIVVAVLLFVASAAHGQIMCAERSTVLTHFGAKYKEGPVAMGLASNGAVLEVLTSVKGSWTIIVTGPTGKTCIVASGEAWQIMDRVLIAKGDSI